MLNKIKDCNKLWKELSYNIWNGNWEQSFEICHKLDAIKKEDKLVYYISKLISI